MPTQYIRLITLFIVVFGGTLLFLNRQTGCGLHGDWRSPAGKINAKIEFQIGGSADQRSKAGGTMDGRSNGGEQRNRSTVVGTLEIHERPTPGLLTPARTIRVWLPPGYSDPANAERRYPVLYMHDGQNLFDAATSGFGMEWQVDETMTALINAGKIEPWIVVGIDHAGEHRVGELSPDGIDVRGQTGHGSRYLAFLVDELIPWIELRYRALDDAEHRALGGSSCGGNITLQAMIERPGVFSRVLIESPALWIGDGVLTERVRGFRGSLPGRVYIGMGTREYGDEARDAALVQMAEDLYQAVEGHRPRPGPDGAIEYNMVCRAIDKDAAHNEDAWARRLLISLPFLLGAQLHPALPEE